MAGTAQLDPCQSITTAGFLPVPIHVLKCLDESQVDLFIQHKPDDQVVLFREAGYPLTRLRAEDLSQKCGETLFVRVGEFGALCQQLFESLDEVLHEERLSIPQRYQLLQTAAAIEIEQSLKHLNANKYVNLSKQMGQQISSLLADRDILPKDIFRLASHDSDTFVHVTNVTCYAVLLAQRLGIANGKELEQIAVGAMLHDLGKRFIAQDILAKPSGLTVEERGIIRSHPQRGYEELVERADILDGQLMIVYQHHERIDGGGYPVGITEDEIHPWAKLVAVVDVFEAMTGKRRYRRPAALCDVLRHLGNGAGKHFDREMVKCWISTMRD